LCLGFRVCALPLPPAIQYRTISLSTLEHILLFSSTNNTETMSTPPRPNSTSPTGSPPKTAPLAEPRRYTRFADAGFGHRLADARNLIHTQAPPVPLRQELMTAVGSVASEVANSIRQAAMFPPGAPKHGWEKGSYRSPFDYHIPGHTISNKDTSADRSFTHASRSSVPSFPPLESVTPTDTRTPRTGQVYEMEPESESDSPCRTATPGPDVSYRYSRFILSFAID
jgi:hypothetical protein